MLTRSGFADDGDVLLDMLRQFDSGDGESEELLPQHSDEPSSLHQVNRKVKISVVRIPPTSAGAAEPSAYTSTKRNRKRVDFSSCSQGPRFIVDEPTFSNCFKGK